MQTKGLSHFIAAGALALSACGDYENANEKASNQQESMGQVSEASLNEFTEVNLFVSHNQKSFSLAVANSFEMSLEGCATGYENPDIRESSVQVYIQDRGCIVKLNRFTNGTTTWVPSLEDPFESWLAGDVATFEDVADPSQKMRVVVTSQLSSPIEEGEVVGYSFSRIVQGADEVIGESVISERHELSVNGEDAPSVAIKGLQYLGVTPEGAGKFNFTLECLESVLGSDSETTCRDQKLVDFKYVLVKDQFEGSLTLEQAADLFATEASSVEPTEILSSGTIGTDNGGFITKVLNGPEQMHKNPEMILVLQVNETSYLYFNVDITVIGIK